MKNIIGFFKFLNSYFIKIILFVFYFLIIGLISVVYKVLKIKPGPRDSYWEEFPKTTFDKSYFSSPY